MKPMNSEIDQAILSVARPSWSKVALIIARTEEMIGDKLPESEVRLNMIAERIEALVSEGRLLAQGNVKNWRHSEIRKP
jgi:hypothetical protein